MRCECCDKQLSDLEATAKFVNENAGGPNRYTNMCNGCLKFLPPEVRIITRNDLPEELIEDEEIEEGDFDDEEESED